MITAEKARLIATKSIYKEMRNYVEGIIEEACTKGSEYVVGYFSDFKEDPDFYYVILLLNRELEGRGFEVKPNFSMYTGTSWYTYSW